MKYWFEIFKTHSDGSTESIDSIKTLLKTKDILSKDHTVKADLWACYEPEDRPFCLGFEVKENTTLEDLDNILLEHPQVTQDLREIIIEGIAEETI